mgnify:FL=1
MKIMLLRLEGVLQSWGERSRWDHRDTSDMPTKSALIGLLGCAMGIPRGDPWLNETARLLQMAVRVDRAGSIMTDFHTVQSRIGKIPNSEGKPRSDTLCTPREYIQDACFTVFLAGNENRLNACFEALRHPAWVPYLGRKSCPPSRPLLPVLTDAYASLEEAVRNFVWDNPCVDRLSAYVRAEVEDTHGPKERSDQPVNASAYAFAKRNVRCVEFRR